MSNPVSQPAPLPAHPISSEVKLGPVLQTLREKVKKLPKHVPITKKTHPLSSYSTPPQNLMKDIANNAEIWETWDQKLNVLLPHKIDNIKPLVAHGKFRLVGLVSLLEHLVQDCGVDARLLEGKVKRLIEAIDR